MLVTVRNGRGVVTFDGRKEGRFDLTTVECLDADGPEEQTLILKREVCPSTVDRQSATDPAQEADPV